MKNSFSNAKNLLQFRDFFKKIPWFLGRHSFGLILIFAFISALLGGFLFYNYVIEPKNQEPKIQEDLPMFQEDTYKKVLKKWELDGQEIDQPAETEYLNPFVNPE